MGPGSRALGVALAVAVVASGVASAVAEAPGLIEVGRTTFERPFTPNRSPNLAFDPETGVLYATSGSDLFVIDAAGGEVAEVIDLETLDPGTNDNWRLMLLPPSPTGRELLVWNWRREDFHVFSLADPLNPEPDRSQPTVAEPNRVLRLAGQRVVMSFAFDADLYDLDARRRIAPPPTPGRPRFYAATGGDTARSLLSLENRDAVTHVTTFDMAVPTRPRLLSDVVVPANAAVRGLLIDPPGSLLVVSLRDAAKTARHELRDPETGALLATVVPSGNGERAFLAGRGTVLVVADAAGLDLIDVVDPGAPRVVGRVDAALFPEPMGVVQFEPAAGDDGRLIFVPATLDGELLVVDIDTATVVARWDPGGPAPSRVALGEGPAGLRRAAVVSEKVLNLTVVEPGGRSRLDLLDLSNPADPVPTGRVERVVPARTEGFETVGGAFGVIADPAENALLLVEPRSGRALDATGFSFLPDRNFTFEAEMLVAAGRWVLGVSTRDWERFEVRGGRLLRRDAGRVTDDVVLSGLIREDGTVVLLMQAYLATVLPDGRAGRLELPFRAARMTLSASGRRLALERPSFFGPGSLAMVDLDDPAAPGVLWEQALPVASAEFLPGDERLFVTARFFDVAFEARLHDVETGAPLGPPSEPVGKFFYHDRGASFRNGDRAGVVMWKWTPTGWETVLFDVGASEIDVVAVLPEFFTAPRYLPRDAEGWYEFQLRIVTGSSRILTGRADGTQDVVLEEPTLWNRPRNLRRGFLAAVDRQGRSDQVVLWRDPALNRPPVADAGGDQRLECAGPGGTPLSLDGAGSSDPDSTPGTGDDIARFAWKVDGVPVGEEVSLDVTLARGAHAIELTVEDVLGASDDDLATAVVADTLPPAVVLTLEPAVDGRLFSGAWLPVAEADDRCDGALAAATALRLPVSVVNAPIAFRAARERAIELRSDRGVPVVVLLGDDETAMRARWQDAVAAGGFVLADARPITLLVDEAPRGETKRLLARYELDAAGSLVLALAVGADADFELEAIAVDDGGLTGIARVSYRQTAAAFCASLPDDAACAR